MMAVFLSLARGCATSSAPWVAKCLGELFILFPKTAPDCSNEAVGRKPRNWKGPGSGNGNAHAAGAAWPGRHWMSPVDPELLKKTTQRRIRGMRWFQARRRTCPGWKSGRGFCRGRYAQCQRLKIQRKRTGPAERERSNGLGAGLRKVALKNQPRARAVPRVLRPQIGPA